MQGTQIDNSTIGNLSTTRNLSMPTLLKAKKHVFLVKYEFEYREKLESKSFPWNFWTIRILMQGKSNDFLVEFSSKSAMFLMEILTEELELVLA